MRRLPETDGVRRAGLLWVLVAALALALGARAEPDAAQQGWLERAEVPVHWDNLAGGSAWLSGPRPRRWGGSRLRSLQLRQGDVATFRLEAGASLRLDGVREPLRQEELVLSWDNGSGLFAQLPLRAAGDGRSLLANPPGGAPVLLRLALVPGRRTPLELALFAGRDANRITAIGYRESLVPEVGGSAVDVVSRTGRRDYWRADRETPVRFAVAGPARVRIDSRLLLPREGVPGADNYRIVATLDDGAAQRFELTTLPDPTADARRDGLPLPLGRSAHAYLDIPAGARWLELRTQRPLLLRASLRRPDGDYLSERNRLWEKNGEREAKPAAELVADYRAVLRLAQDNARPQGGIRAFQALAAWAERYPQQAQYRRLAERVRHRFTHYRPLLAQQAVGDGETYFAQFATTTAGGPAEPGGADLAATPVQAAPERLASGWFTRLGYAGAPAREYLLPEQLPATLLRVAVDRASVPDTAELLLQYDDQAPLRLQLAAATASPATASPATAPGVAQVAFVEIPVAGKVRRLRLWRADGGRGNPAVALAYRTSSWFQLSAEGYRELVAAQGEAATMHLLAEALRRLPSTAPEPLGALDDDALGTLHNQWLPLLRLLHQRHRLFAGRVAATGPGGTPVATTEPPVAVARAARQAAIQGQWQLALEQWSPLAAQGSAEARAGQIQALQMLGEDFLATQWLRHDLLHGANPQWRRQALAELVRLAEASGDHDEVLTLRAVAAVREPDAGTLAELGTALAADHPRLALYVLLALPEQQRPVARVLELSYRLGWWSIFDAALAATPDAGLRALWQGYRAQQRGDFPTAVAHWTAAGAAGVAGQQLAAHLATGLALAADLAASDATTRARARRDLAGWQQQLPGPRGWRNAQRAVVTHAGVRTLSSTALGDHGDWLRATPEQALELVVQGPVTLRLGVRPLHPPGTDAARDDWLALREGAHQEQIPIGANRRSLGLSLSAGDGAGIRGEGVGTEGVGTEGVGTESVGTEGVGAEIAILRELGPGLHRLALAPRQRPVLMRVAFAETQRSLLAEVLPARVAVVAAQEALAPAVADVAPSALPSRNARAVEAPSAEASSAGALSVDALSAEALPVDASSAEAPSAEAPSAEAPSANPATASPVTAVGAVASPGPEPETLAAGLSRLLQEQEATADPQRRLALLVAAEALADGAAETAAAAAAARNAMTAGGATESVRPLLQRLRQGSAWQLVETAERSAGERLIALDGWHPEAPELRARQALLGAAADGELVSGYDTLVLALYNPEPVAIGVRLRVHEVAAQPRLPSQALVALDEGLDTVVDLRADGQPVTHVERMGAGHHRLRVRIAAPLVNQLLTVQFEERADRHARPIVPRIERSYQVATATQPVELMVEGPARLRIDEWRDGQTLVSYRNLPAGVQRVEVPVAPGREEALVRVFRRVVAPSGPVARARPSAPAPAALAEPDVATATLSAPPAPLPLAEPQTRLLERDGTWSLTGAALSRKAVDEEPGGAANPERFLQQVATYRRLVADAATYYEASALVRERERGAPSLGLEGLMSIRKPDWPLDVELAGSLFGQEVAGQSAMATALTLEMRLARDFEFGDYWTQRPSLTFFRRWLNLDAVPCGCDAEEIDQDIFTRYKDQHRQGWRLGERISYRPWLDTLLHGSARLVSNEDFSPGDLDHAAVEFGVAQWFGDLDLDLRYTRFGYFADDDRAQSTSAGRWRLALGFGRWLSPEAGVQADLSYQYDELGGSSVALSLARHFGEGGYYEDFVPGAIDFRGLRQRRALEQQAERQR